LRTAILFAGQVEYFLHLLPVVDEIPLLGVVVGAEHRDHQVIHVTGLRAIEIRGVDKVEGDGLAVRGSARLHPGLVADSAVVSQEQAIGSVEVNHGDHVFSVPKDFAHQRGSSRRRAVRNLHWLALGILSLPCTGKRFQLVE